ncbi:hypothetical protein QTG54_014410 [Skeletonema marinoi]|uniref:DNA2/NAM7 helicase-like C-terminal domain-containing protein n=1 Tax=Skeletonema marinoi TaxID=267567 RepID=A0AAD8XWZ2_9STRA|nr:hypothetical protein QTG54_014410 [Skeletonema marinoi]
MAHFLLARLYGKGQVVEKDEKRKFTIWKKRPFEVIPMLDTILDAGGERREECDDLGYHYDKRMVTKLVRNYRSHPRILQLPNEAFYNGDLIAAADITRSHRFVNWEHLLPWMQKPTACVVHRAASQKLNLNMNWCHVGFVIFISFDIAAKNAMRIIGRNMKHYAKNGCYETRYYSGSPKTHIWAIVQFVYCQCQLD